MRMKQLALCAGALLVGSSAVNADEYLWIYTQGADTLPEGAVELKLSDVSKIGKNSGHYRFHDIRPEIEYGLTNKLTIKGEILIFDHDYSVGKGLEPMYETQGGAGGHFNDTQYAGYEIGFKYNVLSAYLDPFGFAVGGAYEKRQKYRLDGADIDQDSFVATLYFHKTWLDDTLIAAFTPKVEFERRTSPGVLEEEIAFDVAAGIAYRVRPNWYVGLEFRHQSDYLSPYDRETGYEKGVKPSEFDLTDWKLGDQYQHGNYLGPTLHYAQKDWWVTTGILWQIEGGCRCEPGTSNNSDRNWDEHEKYHVGLTFGYEFE